MSFSLKVEKKEVEEEDENKKIDSYPNRNDPSHFIKIHSNSKKERNELDFKNNNSEGKEEEIINFVCGNPNVEEIYGTIHLFKSRKIDENFKEETSRETLCLPKERSKLICILAVPSYISVNNFCKFIGEYGDKMIQKIRILRDGSPNKYLAVLKFDSQEHADEFYLEYHGSSFTSIDPENCHLVFVKNVMISGQQPHEDDDEYSDDEEDDHNRRHISPLSSHYIADKIFNVQVELPTCPVCLERLDDEVSGIITTMCNHEFHSSCLKKWGDSSCPVCRYSLEHEEKEICCDICGSTSNLWVCLTCGHCGCGRYVKGHSRDHYAKTGHCYSMETESKRVWDYVGDRYVHRLILSEEGKTIDIETKEEEDSYSSDSSEEENEKDSFVSDDDKKMKKRKKKKKKKRKKFYEEKKKKGTTKKTDFFTKQIKIKQSEMEEEYNNLLVLNLTQQRVYFEGKLQELERELTQFKTKMEKIEKKNTNLEETLQKEKEKIKDLKTLNRSFEENVDKYRKQVMLIKNQKEKEILELNEQVKDLMMHFQFQNSLKEKEIDEGKEGSIQIQVNKQKPKTTTSKKQLKPEIIDDEIIGLEEIAGKKKKNNNNRNNSGGGKNYKKSKMRKKKDKKKKKNKKR